MNNIEQSTRFITGEYYHVFTKSIAGFRILKTKHECLRMKALIQYYQFQDLPKFSYFIRQKPVAREFSYSLLSDLSISGKCVNIFAYCLMPTHLHLILQQLSIDGISRFMSNVLNSYTRFFNTKLDRKGPLWQSRFKSVHVKSDEQLLHLTRYVHLNPVTAGIVEFPQDWMFSSYAEYLGEVSEGFGFCHWKDVIRMSPVDYRIFINDYMDFQKDLAKVKEFAAG